MFKIPKQEYTAEFKALSVKRVQGGEGIAKVARELGRTRGLVVPVGVGAVALHHAGWPARP